MSAKSEHPLVVLLFGPPGAGKGTQAQLLSSRLALPHISPGDLFRRHIAAADERGRQVRKTLLAGRLVADEVVNEMIAGRLDQPDCRRGY